MRFLLRVFYVAIILSVALACVREKKLDQIDRQLENNNIIEARRLLKTELQLFQDDTLYIRQLKHRSRKIDRLMLFSVYDSLSGKNRVAAEKALTKARAKIKGKPAGERRWYLFDYYLRKGRMLQASQDSTWRDTLGMAPEYPAEEPRLKTGLMFELAFAYADNGDFLDARQWMDKAMRTFEPRFVQGSYLEIYGDYMDGRYARAESLLKENAADGYPWIEVQRFLNLYGDSLTLEDRFKLW